MALVRLLLDAGNRQRRRTTTVRLNTGKACWRGIIEHFSNGYAPMFMACQPGHGEMARSLSGEGSDKEMLTAKKFSPIDQEPLPLSPQRCSATPV